MDIEIIFLQSPFVSVHLPVTKSSPWQPLQLKGNVVVLLVIVVTLYFFFDIFGEVKCPLSSSSVKGHSFGHLYAFVVNQFVFACISLKTPAIFSHVTMQNISKMCHFISLSVHLDFKFLPSFSSDCLKVFFSKILSLACQFVCSSDRLEVFSKVFVFGTNPECA